MMAEIRFCRPFTGLFLTISRVLTHPVLVYSPAAPMDCWGLFESFLVSVFRIFEE